MKQTILRALLVALLTGSATAAHADLAGDGVALAQRKNCMACHAVGKPLMGPSFHDIAGKYAMRADAVDYLAQSIVRGSVGVWGGVPMPANTQLTSAEAHTLAQWVMSLH
ncbi:c-type cytochrome [Burkholderia sp. AU19243]|uniref:c-type cytochrome n=1 Tax=Burkholderia TaxID=32008 RepID=UPI000842190F|nr:MULTISPECIES: c-type cytochrome [Burkholderia]MBR7961947.1 c-type cytochrome [Burkholderia vietnamiensis]AOK05109.1 cytochrome C [Burkholderia latens]MBR8145396.1 c-type cytochrome [Burkholderia vietnamiensis]MBR8366846.1 c-type cytochrome [Burkholderia sp. AU19243]MBY4697384.1 c-type cytochrome [Burkholderia latens]